MAQPVKRLVAGAPQLGQSIGSFRSVIRRRLEKWMGHAVQV